MPVEATVIARVWRGEPAVMVDSGGGDGGDLVGAAETITPARNAFSVSADAHTGISTRSVGLMTDNPAKRDGRAAYGIEIIERVAVPPRVTTDNAHYSATKRKRLDHMLPEFAPARSEASR